MQSAWFLDSKTLAYLFSVTRFTGFSFYTLHFIHNCMSITCIASYSYNDCVITYSYATVAVAMYCGLTVT